MDPEAPGPPENIPTDEEQQEHGDETVCPKKKAFLTGLIRMGQKRQTSISLYRRGDKSGPRIECGHGRPLSTSLRQVGGCQESHHAEWGLAVCGG